jgi:uncharacterized protein (DUF983 family)
MIGSVPVNDLTRILAQLEASLNIATVMCPHCRAINLFPGFTEMLAFICRECGEGVSVEGPVQ